MGWLIALGIGMIVVTIILLEWRAQKPRSTPLPSVHLSPMLDRGRDPGDHGWLVLVGEAFAAQFQMAENDVLSILYHGALRKTIKRHQPGDGQYAGSGKLIQKTVRNVTKFLGWEDGRKGYGETMKLLGNLNRGSKAI